MSKSGSVSSNYKHMKTRYILKKHLKSLFYFITEKNVFQENFFCSWKQADKNVFYKLFLNTRYHSNFTVWIINFILCLVFLIFLILTDESFVDEMWGLKFLILVSKTSLLTISVLYMTDKNNVLDYAIMLLHVNNFISTYKW